MKVSRQRLYDILETGKDGDVVSKIYDFFIMAVIVISIIPLWSHKDTPATSTFSKIRGIRFINLIPLIMQIRI